jgi:hypothetical protein
MNDPFDYLLSDFFGTGPIPPESVARKVLGIGLSLPLNRPGIVAAFRFQVKLLRPDLPDASADALRLDDLKGDRATQLAELLWARDDLMRRAPALVTGPVTGDLRPPGTEGIRNERCRDCGRNWYELRDAGIGGFSQMRRWHAYCHRCARPRERAHQRDRRRRPRINRPCGDCGQSFTGSRSDAAYCSGACRQRAYRQRAKPISRRPSSVQKST